MIGAFVQVNQRSARPVGYIVCENGCWEWTGEIKGHGYGYMYEKGRNYRAHRWMYERVRGPIPAGLQLDHLCRVRHCVNPWHLEPVTNRENALRGKSVVAVHAQATHCIHGHELSGFNLMTQLRGGYIKRSCRTCLYAGQRRGRRRRRELRALQERGKAP